jgi:hypothetical protein
MVVVSRVGLLEGFNALRASRARGLGSEGGSIKVHVIAVHDIQGPEAFGAAVGPAIEKIPPGMTLHSMFPSEDGLRAVCVWEAGSVEDVRSDVDDAAGDLSRNEYYPVADAQAIGLPG